MRGVTRSFWILVAATCAIEALLFYLAVRSLRHVLPCWWGELPLSDQTATSCGQHVAIFGICRRSRYPAAQRSTNPPPGSGDSVYSMAALAPAGAGR
jgi:hypothetical protein